VDDRDDRPRRVSAFRWVPPFAQGLVRDLRVRWALEEVRLPYEERLIGLEDQRSEAYLSLQPFGQVPSYEEDGLVRGPAHGHGAAHPAPYGSGRGEARA
jgi:hypothetical protein